MGEVNFSEAMIALKYWKALEESDALALNEIDCCKNVFASFREWSRVKRPSASYNFYKRMSPKQH